MCSLIRIAEFFFFYFSAPKIHNIDSSDEIVEMRPGDRLMETSLLLGSISHFAV